MSLHSQPTSRKPGRPSGSAANPHNLIFKDLKGTLQLMADLKAMITKQMQIADRELETADLNQRLAGIEALANAMDTLTKTLQQVLKFLQTDGGATPINASTEEQKRQMLERFLGKTK